MEIRTPRLILRNWRDGDRDLFHHINSDDEVLEFFPFRRSRTQTDQLMDWLREDIERHGIGFSAIEIAETGETAGFAGISTVRLAPFFPESAVEIGWRLARHQWGKGIASEAARAWLRYGFEVLDLQEIHAFAVADNHRSIAVMRRIGMVRNVSLDFRHPMVPDTHPHLQPHVVWSIGRTAWCAVNPFQG